MSTRRRNSSAASGAAKSTQEKKVLTSAATSRKSSVNDKAEVNITTCPSCNKSIETRHRSIECYECLEWYHFGCSGVSQQTFDFLSNSGGDAIQWVCAPCLSIGKKGRENKLDVLLHKMEIMEKQIDNLKGICSGQDIDNKIEKAVEKKVAEVLDEKLEIEKSQLHIVVVGLEEGEGEERAEADKQKVSDIIKEINPDKKDINIEEVTRLGKPVEGRNRLLKFKVKSLAEKEKILRNSYKINKDRQNKIYFNPDRTQLQREKHRKLRDDLKRIRDETGNNNFVIRGYEIVEKRGANDENNA